jgi:hypothetical protein
VRGRSTEIRYGLVSKIGYSVRASREGNIVAGGDDPTRKEGLILCICFADNAQTFIGGTLWEGKPMERGRYHELINIKPVTQTPLVSSLLIFIFILKPQSSQK